MAGLFGRALPSRTGSSLYGTPTPCSAFSLPTRFIRTPSKHPYVLLLSGLTYRPSRLERVFVWVACFGYSFLMASFTVQFTDSPDCDKIDIKTTSDVSARLNCQTKYPSYFLYTFGAISAASFVLNNILESVATCKCSLTGANEVRFTCSF